ncbi:MAG: hypothetical protein ABI254_07500, partial [Chthoniobacterales bacterium]
MLNSTKTSLPHIESQLGTPEFFQNPYPVYAQLREEAPVYWCEKWNSWLVTRNDDSREVVKDTQVFSNTGRHTVLLQQIEGSARGR